jgi:hypothetical protein
MQGKEQMMRQEAERWRARIAPLKIVFDGIASN